MGWPCPNCDRELSTERGMRQHHTKVHGEPVPNRTCEGCGTEFYDPKAQRAHCDDCNPNAGEHNGNWKGGKEDATCRSCGDELSFYPSEKKGVYCPECVAESDEFLGTPYHEVHEFERVRRECKYCGDEMLVLQTEAGYGHGRYCSRDCHSRWMSENWVGENHPSWKERDSVYSRSWWRVREAARERDEHSCQSCGITRGELGREPDVHHIVPIREFEDSNEAHTLDNLLWLCPSCHRSVERGETPWSFQKDLESKPIVLAMATLFCSPVV